MRAFLALFFISFTTFLHSYSQVQPVNSLIIENYDIISDVDISQNQQFIAIGGLEFISLYYADSLQSIFNISLDRGVFTGDVKISNNNKYILAGLNSGNALLIDANDGDIILEVITRVTFDSNPQSSLGVRYCTFSNNNKTFFTGNDSGHLDEWDIKTGEKLRSKTNFGPISYLESLSNKDEIVILGGAIVHFSLDIFDSIHVYNGITPSLSKDGRVLQTNVKIDSGIRAIRHYDLNSKSLLKEFPFPQDEIVLNAIDISPDGQNFLIGNTVRQNNNSQRVLYDAVTPGSIRSYNVRSNVEKNSPESEDLLIKYFPFGRKFLTVNGNAIHIWDISDVVTRVRGAGIHNN